jgi:hypothetical protein|nr:MAG TPA: DNA helix destabilizing protein [Caudoviricetes sp.]
MAKVVTNEVRFSYAHLWEPQAINGSEPKYSVSLIIPKTDKGTVKAIKDAIEIAKQEGIGKFNGKIPANLKLPLRDGDIERPDDENYQNSYFINCNSKDQPQIVDRKVQPILDRNEFYSGCYGRASISLYAYNVNGNRGIAASINSVQKTRDGDSLGGRSRAEDDFTALDDDDDDFLS